MWRRAFRPIRRRLRRRMRRALGRIRRRLRWDRRWALVRIRRRLWWIRRWAFRRPRCRLRRSRWWATRRSVRLGWTRRRSTRCPLRLWLRWERTNVGSPWIGRRRMRRSYRWKRTYIGTPWIGRRRMGRSHWRKRTNIRSPWIRSRRTRWINSRRKLWSGRTRRCSERPLTAPNLTRYRRLVGAKVVAMDRVKFIRRGRVRALAASDSRRFWSLRQVIKPGARTEHIHTASQYLTAYYPVDDFGGGIARAGRYRHRQLPRRRIVGVLIGNGNRESKQRKTGQRARDDSHSRSSRNASAGFQVVPRRASLQSPSYTMMLMLLE